MPNSSVQIMFMFIFFYGKEYSIFCKLVILCFMEEMKLIWVATILISD